MTVVAFMTIVIFTVDLLTPLWYDVWVLYLIPLFFMFQSARRPYVYSVIVTLLIVLGLFIPHSDNMSLLRAAANRSTGIFGGWGVSILLMRLRRLQEELVLKEQLAILGQLSGSVAHELRNPLGVVNNAIYYLKTVLPDADDTVKEYLNIIKCETDNAVRIISDLLDFSRTKQPQMKPTAVNELIRESLDKCTIAEDIQVDIDMPASLPLILIDPFQMVQVFQNLITNAVQAMPEGGRLLITARMAPFKKSSVPALVRKSTRKLLPIQNLVEISVIDTGEGITPENMRKLFQPLFTTKATGIGLGLVVSKKLTEINGGRIVVDSKPNRGTTLTVTLPANSRQE